MGTYQQILTAELGMHRVTTKSMPRILTADEKQKHVNVCEELHQIGSIPHTTVMFYGDCMKMCEDSVPNFGDKRTGSCIMKMHHLTLPISPRNFLPKTT
jgi:hypothetical protein